MAIFCAFGYFGLRALPIFMLSTVLLKNTWCDCSKEGFVYGAAVCDDERNDGYGEV
jgi:hypothetical protein